VPRLANDAERESSPLEAHFADEIGDEPLRLLFVCCHEAVPAESRVALALRTLCGFSTAESARSLFTTDAEYGALQLYLVTRSKHWRLRRL